jgi:hypothetical protein
MESIITFAALSLAAERTCSINATLTRSVVECRPRHWSGRDKKPAILGGLFRPRRGRMAGMKVVLYLLFFLIPVFGWIGFFTIPGFIRGNRRFSIRTLLIITAVLAIAMAILTPWARDLAGSDETVE